MQILNSLSLGNTNGINSSLNLPGLDVDLGVDIDVGGNDVDNGTDTPTPGTPTTLREVLMDLVNEQVQITTPFGAVSGTLLLVRDDYVVIVESTGAQVLVRIEKIEFVSEL